MPEVEVEIAAVPGPTLAVTIGTRPVEEMTAYRPATIIVKPPRQG